MDTNTTLLIMTNGRKEYLEQTLSTLGKLRGNFTRTLIHDDSGDSNYKTWLKGLGNEIVTTNKIGFTGAMISAWDKLKEDSNEWVFHLEEDFLIMEDINLDNMMDVMNHNNYIKQIVLSRQLITKRRLKKRGVVIPAAERFKDKTDGKNFWVEHRINFSCNPCLYRKALIYEYPWPNVPRSEHQYGNLLLKEDSSARCAYWGKSTDNPKVIHIGKNRTGFNY